MHAEELRAGHVLWPEPSNAPCVHDLDRFVKAAAFRRDCLSTVVREKRPL